MSPNPWVTRVARLVRFGLHLIQGVLLASFVLPWLSTAARARVISRWSAKILRILALRYHVRGTPPAARGGLLFVANHVSWLDIWLLLALRAVRFVSKSEVRGWPVIGWLAAQTGTLFIERTRRLHTATINEQIATALGAGNDVAMFPEGTTTDGLHLKAFHASLLQPAVDLGAQVVPVAIRYVLPDGRTDTTPAYHGDTTLLQSLRAILARRELEAEVAYLAPIDARGKTRRELAQAAQAAIAAALNLPAPHRESETPVDPPAVAQKAFHPTGSPYPTHSSAG